jgi:hypothetical protein
VRVAKLAAQSVLRLQALFLGAGVSAVHLPLGVFGSVLTMVREQTGVLLRSADQGLGLVLD